jgi:hypothetical protein
MGRDTAPERRSHDEVIASLRNKLLDYVGISGRAAATFVELVQLRIRLHHVRHELHELDRAHFAAMLYEAERTVARRLDDVDREKRWSVLFRYWNEALVDAAEKLEREADHRAAFAAYAAEEPDEHREFGRAAFEAAAARWREA